MRFIAVCCWILLCSVAVGADPPGTLLDLTNWRLTLPVDTARSGTPDEVEQPDLRTFDDEQYFCVDDKLKGVVLRAHCGGVPTKGSKYPRCELREMSVSGKQQAAWDTNEETIHTMTLTAAVTALPQVKRHVVCAQIHDANDDLLMVRLEGTKLFIERNEEEDVMLDSKYELGTPFDLKIEAGQGHVNVCYDGTPKVDWEVSREGCYFKAGCYTQSNPNRGDQPGSYGEVVIFQLRACCEAR